MTEWVKITSRLDDITNADMKLDRNECEEIDKEIYRLYVRVPFTLQNELYFLHLKYVTNIVTFVIAGRLQGKQGVDLIQAIKKEFKDFVYITRIRDCFIYLESVISRRVEIPSFLQSYYMIFHDNILATHGGEIHTYLCKLISEVKNEAHRPKRIIEVIEMYKPVPQFLQLKEVAFNLLLQEFTYSAMVYTANPALVLRHLEWWSHIYSQEEEFAGLVETHLRLISCVFNDRSLVHIGFLLDCLQSSDERIRRFAFLLFRKFMLLLPSDTITQNLQYLKLLHEDLCQFHQPIKNLVEMNPQFFTLTSEYELNKMLEKLVKSR